MRQEDKIWEIRVEAAAQSMMASMFAKHELPLNEDLYRKYHDTAAEALTAAEVAANRYLRTITQSQKGPGSRQAAPQATGAGEAEMINHPNRKKTERAVVVTTSHRGVFFGYAKDIDGAIVKLRSARNCIYWSADVRGFMGLAATGPSNNCKVGPAADISLRDITSVMECSPEAIAAWENAPWAR